MYALSWQLSLGTSVFTPDVQHKHRSNKKKTHDQNWNRSNFEPWRVLSVEPPHPTSPCGRGTACTPCPTAGIFPLPDGGSGGAGSHSLAGGAAGGADAGGAGVGPGHGGGAAGARRGLTHAPLQPLRPRPRPHQAPPRAAHPGDRKSVV